MADLYVPPRDETPGIPHHVKYMLRNGDTIVSARCTGCDECWDVAVEIGFVEWFREHTKCSQVTPSSTSD